MQADIKRAEQIIQNLQHDKETLKSALASAVRKKDEIYKILLEYKEAFDNINSRTLQAESKLDEIGLVKNEIEKVKNQLIRRDEKIRSLHNRNLALEQLLEEQGITSNVWKNMYKETQADDNRCSTNLEIAVDIMLNKVRLYPKFHRLFKTCIPCINYFKDLIEHEKYEEALIRTCTFAVELMKNEEKYKFREFSPGISELQNSASSLNVTGQLLSFNQQIEGEEYDENRIHKLAIEIQNNVAKSKEVLSSKSFSSNVKQAKVEDIASGKNTHIEKQEKKDNYDNLDKSHTEENEEKSIKNNIQEKKNSSLKPQIKIIRRPGSKSAKALPKVSILKRTD